MWALPITICSLMVSALEAQSGRPLDANHWSRDLAQTLEILDPSTPRMVDSGILTTGILRLPAGEHDGEWEVLRRGWLESLVHQHPSARQEPVALGVPLGVAGAFGYRREANLLEEGEGGFVDLSAEARGESGLGGWFQGRWADGGPLQGVESLGAFWEHGAFHVSAGRQSTRVGPGETDPVTEGNVGVDQLRLGTTRPVEGPGPLGFLGPTSFQMGVGTLEGTGDVDRPLYGIMSVAFRPHPAVEVGGGRSAAFAGEGRPSVTTRRVLGMLAGWHSSADGVEFEFEDQYAILYGRVRTEVLGPPVSIYGGLGINDTEGAVRDDPAVVAGIRAPFAAFGGVLSLGYEYGAIGPRARVCWWCEVGRRLRTWYDHFVYGRHEVGGVPLGSSLGGYGARHVLRGAYWHEGGERHLQARVFFEVREEGNLLEDRWPGKRRGVRIDGFARLAEDYRLEGRAVVAGGPEVDWDVGGELWIAWQLPFSGPPGR